MLILSNEEIDSLLTGELDLKALEHAYILIKKYIRVNDDEDARIG